MTTDTELWFRKKGGRLWHYVRKAWRLPVPYLPSSCRSVNISGHVYPRKSDRGDTRMFVQPDASSCCRRYLAAAEKERTP